MVKNKRKYKSFKRTRMKRNKKILPIILISVIIIIIGVIFVILGINSRQNILPIYTYTAQKTSNYKVLLKPNEFYTTETLPSGGYYAAKSVKEYLINLKYDFIGKSNANIEYNYNIIAELVGTAKTNDDQGKEVWNRVFTLVENKSNKQDDIQEFLIDENINIDYEYYNNLARSYEKNYGIIIDSVLKVRLNISHKINTHNKGIDTVADDDYIELDIPITNNVTEIKENYEDVTNKDITTEDRTFNINEIIYYIIGGILILGALLIIIIKIIKTSKNKMTFEEKYKFNISKILKYYKELIVTVTNKPDLSNLKVMDVSSLDDLIDVAEQSQSNIIHYEVVKNEESMLYVIADGYVYVYVVTDDELK